MRLLGGRRATATTRALRRTGPHPVTAAFGAVHRRARQAPARQAYLRRRSDAADERPAAALAQDLPLVGAGADDVIRVIGWAWRDAATNARGARRDAAVPRIGTFLIWADCLAAWLDRRPADVLAILSSLSDRRSGRSGSDVPRRLAVLRRRRNTAPQRARGGPGYFAAPTSTAAGSSMPCEAIPRFRRSWRTQKRARSAGAAFREAGGRFSEMKTSRQRDRKLLRRLKQLRSDKRTGDECRRTRWCALSDLQNGDRRSPW